MAARESGQEERGPDDPKAFAPDRPVGAGHSHSIVPGGLLVMS